MYPVTDEFLAAVQTSHVAAFRAVTMLGGLETGELRIASGAVTIDGRRNGALRSIQLAVVPDADDDAWERLTTPGVEIKVWRGVRFAVGVEELVPLGVFVPDGSIDQDDDGPVTLAAADRAMRIRRAHWTSAYTIAATTDLGAALGAMVYDRWPDVTLGFSTLGVALPNAITFVPGPDTDPWADARKLAGDHGYDLYFDGDGILRVRPVPDPDTTAPVIAWATGDGGEILGRRRSASFATTYNGVIATGEGTDIAVPVRGEAWDTDPASPSYRWGPMGQVPLFYSSPLLTTQGAVDAASATRLARVRGRVTQRTWKVVVNPAIDAFDVADVTERGTTGRYMIDSLTIPLIAREAMTVVARETRAS